MHGGVRCHGPIAVVRDAGLSGGSLGQGRPTVPHRQSQMTTPSTCCRRVMISVLSRVCSPDQAFLRGSAPGLMQMLQITNSSTSVGRSKTFVLLPSRQPLADIAANDPFGIATTKS